MSRNTGPTPWTVNSAGHITYAQPAPNTHAVIAVPWTPASALLPTILEPLGYQVASFRPGRKRHHLPTARITAVKISSLAGISSIAEIDHNTVIPNVAAFSIRAQIRLESHAQAPLHIYIAPQFLIDRHGNIAFTTKNPPHPDAPSNLASSFAIHDHFFFDNNDNYEQMLEAWLAILDAKARNALEANLLRPHQLATNHALRIERILPAPSLQTMVSPSKPTSASTP